MEEAVPGPPPAPSPTRDVEENRLVAGLAWLWVLSVIVLLVKKDSPYVQHHARQGFVLFLASIIVWIALGIFGAFALYLRQLLNFAVFVLIVVGFVQAVRGKWWVLPVLGPLAPKIRL